MADVIAAEGEGFSMSISLMDEGVYEQLALYLDELGQRMVDTAHAMIEESAPAGRVYVDYGVAHEASAPGQPPAPITHEYELSVQHNVHIGAQGPVLEFGSPDPKAEKLEVGTVYMLPRPLIRPAAEAVLAEEGASFEDVFMEQSFEGPIQEFG